MTARRKKGPGSVRHVAALPPNYAIAKLRAKVYSAVLSSSPEATTNEMVDEFIAWVTAAPCEEDRDLRMFCLETVGKHWKLQDAAKVKRRVHGLYYFSRLPG